MKLLKGYTKEIVKETKPSKRLRVFDFDDTLVKTDSWVHVTSASGNKIDLSPGQFAIYDRQPGDVFDYSDFEKLVNPRSIRWVVNILRNVYDHHGPTGAVVLSARGESEPIEQFLANEQFLGIEVIALGDPTPQAKADWISERIHRDGLSMVEYFEDSPKHVSAVKQLQHLHPGVEIIVRHIVHAKAPDPQP
jgi:FMN phosphatase YigB (HAD superfamily)